MVRRSTFLRPQRSARETSGNAPNEAKRRAASPSPNIEPDSPTTLRKELVDERWPKCLATSLSDEMAPNWAKPATRATRKSTTVTRSATRADGADATGSAKLYRVVHHDQSLTVIATTKEQIE